MNSKQTLRVLQKLRSKERVSNKELNRVCLRYGARIFDLRKNGYVIKSINNGLGYWSFQLISEPKK